MSPTAMAGTLRRARCNVCGAVPPPRSRGQLCIGCSARIHGISVSLPTGNAFVGEGEGSRVRAELLNNGQTALHVTEIVLIDRYSNQRSRLLGEVEEPLEIGSLRTVEFEVPGSTTPGTYIVGVATREGVTAEGNLKILPLPNVVVCARDDFQGKPLMQLAPDDGRKRRQDGAGAGVDLASPWEGRIHLNVQTVSSDPLQIASVEIQIAGRPYPMLLTEKDLSVAPRADIQLGLSADSQLVNLAAAGFVDAQVVVRIVGSSKEIRRSFLIGRLRRADFALDWKEIRRELAEQKRPAEVLDETVMLHGLGKRIEATVYLGNRGDLDVEVAGPIQTGSEAVQVRDPLCLQGRTLRAPDSTTGAIEREPVKLFIEPDRLSFEAYARPTGGSPVLEVQLSLPVRDPKRPGEEGHFEVTDRFPITLLQADAEDSFLCIDLGTTNTCVYLARQDTSSQALESGGVPEEMDPDPKDQMGNEYPSLVGFDDHPAGLHSFGATQRSKMFASLRFFQATASEFKPHIGSSIQRYFIDLAGNRVEIRHRDIAEIYLAHVLKEIRRLHLSGHPQSVRLTCPVDFDAQERELLVGIVHRALGRNDLDVQVPWSEPEALLINMLFAKDGIVAELPFDEPRIIAMFDFGGGTTDLLVQKITLTKGDGGNSKEVRRRYLQKFTFREAGEELTRILSRELWPMVMEPLSKDKAFSAAALQATIKNYVPPKTMREVDNLDDAGKQIYSAMISAAELVKRKYAVLKDPKRTEKLFQHVRIGDAGCNIQLDTAINDLAPVDGVIDAFVEPKLKAFLEVEAKLKEKTGKRFDIVFLAGNSSKLTRVQDLARKIFGAERVRYVGDEHAKEGVARGLAFACLNAIPAIEDRFALRIGGQLFQEQKDHDLLLTEGQAIEVLWKEDLDLGKESFVSQDPVPLQAIGVGPTRIRLDVNDQKSEIILFFLDPVSRLQRHVIRHAFLSTNRPRLCFQIGMTKYLDGERHDVTLQAPRLGVKRMNSLGELSPTPVAVFDLRSVLRPGMNGVRLSLLLSTEGEEAVLNVFEPGAPEPLQVFRQPLAS